MNILVLTNIGSRDVLHNGQEIRPARAQGERLLAEYETCAAQLSFPIVEPCLRYLLDRHPEETLLVYLFGTDQPDPAFQPTDTLYFAQLMARRLPQVLGGRVHASAIPLQGINPSFYDLAMEAYARLLEDINPPQVSVCYVALAGGVPACNTALLLQGVRRYGDRLQVIYTPQGGEPIPIRLGQQVLRSFREAAAVERLQQFDFANALALLQQLDLHPGLSLLAEYAARRLDFDFHQARHCLEETLQQGDAQTRLFAQNELRHDLDAVLQETNSPKRLAALLCELSWNAAICWKHRRYADFLARLYRFQEAALRYLVEKFFALPTDISPPLRQTTLQRWNEGLQTIPGLMEYLRRSSAAEKLDWSFPSRPAYKALLSFALQPETAIVPEPQRDFYAALVRKINALDPLVELRHRTIVGHDFQGVSAETILQASPPGKDGQPLPPDRALTEISRMINAQERPHQSQVNPYEQIVSFLLARLQKG